MMRSLFSGVSGLKNHQTRMDVIGNNISNVNTTGFKSSRVNFTDMLSQNLSGASSPQDGIGGTNPKQIGLGSAVGAVDLLFTNGSVQSTGVNTDLALSGSNTLFVVNTGSGTAYTRNGDFQFDAEGNYVQAGNGYYVQGWMANDKGELPPSKNAGNMKNITVEAGKTMAPAASQTATYTNNLNAEIPTITAIAGGTVGTPKTFVESDHTSVTAGPDPCQLTITYATGGTPATATTTVDKGSYQVGGTITVGGTDYTITQIEQPTVEAAAGSAVTLTLSDGSTVSQTSGVFQIGHSTPIVTTLSVYDTLGSVHEVPVYFTLTSAADDLWEVALTTDGTSSYSWTEPDGSTTTVTMNPQKLKFDTHGSHPEGSGVTTLTLTNGSEPSQDVQLDFSNLTQYSSSSTVAGKADGNAAGTLASIAIDKTGTITGTYTNGMKRVEAQVAVAQFTNPGGLNKVGESLYEESNNSGQANVNTAASFGATITPSALEMSNVDVANEFTDMIITQRGFQTNSKIITVSDEMLETVVNMKR